MPIHTKLESLEPAEQALLTQLCEHFPGVPERDALRFLVARNFELSKAMQFLRADVDWRSSYAPSDVTQARLPHALPSGCWRSLGSMQCDGISVAVLWIQMSLWWPEQYDVAEYTALLVYFMEKLSLVGEQFVVLFDMQGWRLSHGLHLRKVFAHVSTLQEHYPERLRAALMLHTPGIFSASWKLIRPWLDPATAAKVHFLPTDDGGALFEHVNRTLVPAQYGGTLQEADTQVPGLTDEPAVCVVGATGQSA